VNFCPKKVLEVTEVGKCAIIKDKEKDCISCGQCEMRCPDYAIFVEK
jgi:2-oxoglutarate ferredoxin oxidoreductase subunit delta